MLDKVKKIFNFKGIFFILLGLMIFYFIYFAVAITLSTKEDLQGRGFVKCTDVLIMELDICVENEENASIIRKSSCYISSVFKNTYCDSSVILNGYKKWLKGEISRPWDEYIFEPITELENSAEYKDLDFTKSQDNSINYDDFIKAEKSLKETIKDTQDKTQ